MAEILRFTKEEKRELVRIIRYLRDNMENSLTVDDEKNLRTIIENSINENKIERDVFGLNPILLSFQTAEIELQEIGMKRDCVLAILLYNIVTNDNSTAKKIEETFGKGVAQIIHGLVRIQDLYSKNPVIESENFKSLLLSFAEDMRVILIMIAERVCLMRQIRDTENEEAKRKVSEEASYLYAPLAHKLGLYKLKSELEDLSLKYLEHDVYYAIKENLTPLRNRVMPI